MPWNLEHYCRLMIKRLFTFARTKIGKLARSTTGGPAKAPSARSIDREDLGSVPEPLAVAKDQVDATERKTTAYRRESQKKSQKAKSWSLDQFEVIPMPGKSRFHDFELPLELMHAIADLKFEYCTPIQEKALPIVLGGGDLVGKAQTGTGKSAVFLIATLASLLKKQPPVSTSKKFKPRALVIAPTRELVVQIAKDGYKLAKYTSLKVTAVYGGVDYQKQLDETRKGRSDIIVATPGRLLDFVNKRAIVLDRCEIMVIDEADRMLDMGFIPDVRRIIGRLPGKDKRQTMLFSATVTEDVKRLAFQWCRKPGVVEVEVEQVAVDTVDQIVYLVTTEEKYNVLYNLIQAKKGDRILVFANQKHEAKSLSERLRGNNIQCSLLSGDVPQHKRTQRLEAFRSGRNKVLIATDVAGRGIHIQDISHVVNYTLPYEPEDYVHRIGRTGRAGASGTSISFACEEGGFYLPDIEEYIGRKLECVVPEETLLKLAPKPSERKKPSRRPRRRRKPAGRRTEGRSGG